MTAGAEILPFLVHPLTDIPKEHRVMKLQQCPILPEKGLTSNQELKNDLAYKIIFGILVLIYMVALLTVFFYKISSNIKPKIHAVENVSKKENTE